MDIDKFEENLDSFPLSIPEALQKLVISSIHIEARIQVILANQVEIMHQLDGSESKEAIEEKMNEEITRLQHVIFAMKVSK